MKRILLPFLLCLFAAPALADITITAANVTPVTGYTFTDGTAGATITAGQVVYKDASDGDAFKLADCDASATTSAVIGIALHGAADGQPLRVQTAGSINIGGTVAVGSIYILSGTAGGIQVSTDVAQSDWVSVLGIATTTGIISLRIHNSGVQVPGA